MNIRIFCFADGILENYSHSFCPNHVIDDHSHLPACQQHDVFQMPLCRKQGLGRERSISCWSSRNACVESRCDITGADRPYEKLRKALRADVDEAAWSSIYSNLSRPFPKPQTGKIAVKVINHYGDEVLKVYSV